MKNIIILISTLLLASSTVQAQDLPKSGFEIKFSEEKLVLEQGSSENLTVEFLRSKRFRNVKINLQIQGLPKGLNAEIQQPELDSECEIRFIASPDLKPGSYTAIVSGKTRKLNKGKLLTIEINSKTISSR